MKTLKFRDNVSIARQIKTVKNVSLKMSVFAQNVNKVTLIPMENVTVYLVNFKQMENVLFV